ncbi:MAG: replicative DNA helicase [Deltaproteobacteria bacterium]|nr:replicative DNA helicase [Deltaproteobacteria bacterium]
MAEQPSPIVALPSGRQPPHNLEAERSALGGVLVKPTAFDEMATVIAADDFLLPAHREIFEAMLQLDKRRVPIDVISLGDELKSRGALGRLENGQAYLIDLANSVPTAENIGHYARLVQEKATLRRLIAACAEIQSRAYGEFGDYEEFLDEAERLVFQVAQKNRRENARPIGEIIQEVLDAIDARGRERKEITGVPTGFHKLDAITAGFQPENLVIVAARPGVGKTSWALNVACHAAMNHQIPVLVFSLEMSKVDLIERLIAGEAKIDSHRMRRGLIEYSEWKTKIYPAGDRIRQAPLLIDDSPAMNILELRAKARRFRSDPRFFPPHKDGPPPLGLVVIDYLQLAQGLGGRKDESREREIAEISRGLKALAKELHLPIIAVSQLNRAVEKRDDKTPQLSDLRESGAIEQDADVILFIHREEMYKSDGNGKGKALLKIGKNRTGPIGEVDLTFIKEYTKFENYAADDDEALR